MNLRPYLIGGLLGGIGSAAVATAIRPTPVAREVLEDVVVRDNSVTLTLHTVEERTKTRTIKVREETRPDGTVIKEREREVAESERQERTGTTEEKDTQAAGHTRIVERPVPPPRWYTGVLVGLDARGNGGPVYGGQASYRLIGPFSVGVFGLTNLTFGGSIGVQF